MYHWIWRKLPGNGFMRAVIALLLVAATVHLLFEQVFPWLEPLLPFNDASVSEASAVSR
ncbi:hypothetical protein [Streptomyces sp. NPDC090021]|uniref:hypothetical protein n=1 Tax=Streptomyces sp. NPDC090021 TaxID=3365919 RepID=UPI0037F888EF